MKTHSENQKQPKNSSNRDRQIFDDEILSNEPKDHLHQNYRHWAWLPKPR